MLRIIFVLLLVLYGLRYAAKNTFGALLFYLWVAYFRPDNWAFDAPILQALSLSFVAGGILLLRAVLTGARFRFDVRVLLLLVFFIWTFISTAESPDSAYAWPFWIDFAKAAVTSYLLAVLVTTREQFRTTILVIALSLGFEAAKQGWIQLLLHPGSANYNGHLMLGDNNGLAVGMLMLVTLFIALAQTAQKPWERWMHRFLVLGIAYRAISTYSRGCFIAAGVILALYIVRSKQRARASVAAFLVAGIIASVLPQTFWDRMSTIHVSEDSLEEDSARSRPHFWRVALVMANANPLFGVGYNAYNRAYNRYDFSSGRWGRNRSVHSMWFGVLAELGFPGLAVYIAMLMMAVIGSGAVVGKAARGEIPYDFYYYGVALQMAFIAAFVGGSFVPWQYTEMLWHFLGLSMALRWISQDPALAAEAAAARVAPAPPPPKTVFRPNPAIHGARAS